MMEIRNVKDAGVLSAMNRELQDLHFKQRPDIFKPFDEEAVRAHFENCLSDSSYWHLGVYNARELLGFIQAQQMDKPATAFAHGYRYIHIHQIAVKKEHEGKGAGRILINTVLDIARKKNIERVDLTVWDFNKHARSFNSRYGFKEDLIRMYISTSAT